METYKESYKKIKQLESNFIETMFYEIVYLFNTIWLEPITIGNMVYYYCQEDGKDVPAYCYSINYKNDLNGFKPIYDRLGGREYGWADIESVIRILDTIRDKYYQELNVKAY